MKYILITNLSVTLHLKNSCIKGDPGLHRKYQKKVCILRPGPAQPHKPPPSLHAVAQLQSRAATPPTPSREDGYCPAAEEHPAGRQDQVPATHPRYELRSGAGRGRMGQHLASAPASTAGPRFRQPNQLSLSQRQIHLVEVKHCEDTRPENQIEAAKQQPQSPSTPIFGGGWVCIHSAHVRSPYKARP